MQCRMVGNSTAPIYLDSDAVVSAALLRSLSFRTDLQLLRPDPRCANVILVELVSTVHGLKLDLICTSSVEKSLKDQHCLN
jgi:hypothetical protein